MSDIDTAVHVASVLLQWMWIDKIFLYLSLSVNEIFTKLTWRDTIYLLHMDISVLFLECQAALFCWISSYISFFFLFELNLITLKAVGIVAAIGDSVKHVKVGMPAAIMTFGSYAEFTMVICFWMYIFGVHCLYCLMILYNQQYSLTLT